ncbi:MAG TPA: hypothetical protein VIV83_14370 [Gemmatimonadales bacterium]
MTVNPVRVLPFSLLAVIACSGGSSPHITTCTTAGDTVTLAAWQYASIDPAGGNGCTVYPAAGGSGAQYLLVPQITTGTPGQQTGYRLVGDTLVPAPSAPVPAAARISAAQQFHDYLRLGDQNRSWGFAPEAGAASRPRLSATGSPPGVGTLRHFKVCAKVDCSKFDDVFARVRALASKVAIYVDTLAPAGGLDSAQLDSLAQQFDTTLYAVDTAAFGRESDIDSNSVVLVLMTNTVNKLVTASSCVSSGFVAGFFFGADLDPAFKNDSRSNKGEVFYSIVADPAGTLSCTHSQQEVEAFVPVTFIHEFQHMISFGQHVLARGGTGEVLWLNEGLSHYAEELGGRRFELAPAAKLTDCTIGTITCRFYAGDLLDAYTYLDSTGSHFLEATAGIGTLAERGADWLFVRYLVDRYAAGSTLADWNTFTRSMEQTTQTGAQNIAAVTGTPFATVVSRWALANYATDNGSAPPELTYNSWDLHSVFSSLHTQRPTLFPKFYPLVPTSSAGSAVNLSGTLRAGSAVYHFAVQNPGDPGFTLSFTQPNGALINAVLGPRLNVLRIQ